MTIKVGAVATLLGSALLSGCATVGGGNLNLGFQRSEPSGHHSSSSGEVVPTLQWKMALNGPKKVKDPATALHAADAGAQDGGNTLLWSVVGFAAGYYLVQELTQKKKTCPTPVTVLPIGFTGTVTTTTRC